MQSQVRFSGNTHHLQEVIPFVGREDDTADILRMLDDTHCRLITLIGPGGMGKTRLALQIAELAADRFADGCCWVDLQPLKTTEYLLQAVIDVLGLAFSGEPLVQLTSYLRPRELLLVFDNFEHLLDGAALLTQLLASAPKVKMLVTSREALNLREEWVRHLEGLPYPPAEAIEQAEAYPAVELFVKSASRASASFVFENERQAVVRICRRVAGMPLALELAAAWTRSLSCTEIAGEIQNGLALLTARTRDIPERHRSIKAVFEKTCAMLSDEEYATFQRLSVFQGGFQRDAAEAIAEAAPSVLAALIDKALLKLDAAGRYHMHELIAQYAGEQLSASSTAKSETERQHSRYYADFSRRWENDLYEGQQKEAVTAIRLELDNIRTAWQWAITKEDIEIIQAIAPTLSQFGLLQSRDIEMSVLFASAVETLRNTNASKEADSVLASLLVFQASPLLHLGRTELAVASIEESITLYQRLGADQVPEHVVHPKVLLCLIESFLGNHERALEIGEDAQRVSDKIGHEYSLQWAYYALALAALNNGIVDRAWDTAQRAHAMAIAKQNNHFKVEINTVLGNIAFARGNNEAAQHYHQTALQFADALGMLGNKAASLNFLGNIDLSLGNYTEALDYFEQSRAICQRLYNLGRLLLPLQGCARTKLILHQNASAWADLREALDIGIELQFVPRVLSILVDIAELLIVIGEAADAIHLLHTVSNHSAVLPETTKRIEAVVAQYQLEWTPPESDAPESLDILTANLPHELPQLSTGDSDSLTTLPKFKQALIEPLTEREQEVLHYIAEGFSNREIAETLVISVSTVKSHINNLYGKLGVLTRDEAITRTQELNLL